MFEASGAKPVRCFELRQRGDSMFLVIQLANADIVWQRCSSVSSEKCVQE